jgi:hypothetical protein
MDENMEVDKPRLKSPLSMADTIKACDPYISVIIEAPRVDHDNGNQLSEKGMPIVNRTSFERGVKRVFVKCKWQAPGRVPRES